MHDMSEEKVVSINELEKELKEKLKPAVEQIAKEIFGVKLGGFYLDYRMALFDMPEDEVWVSFRVPLCTIKYDEIPEDMYIEEFVDSVCWIPGFNLRVEFYETVVTVRENYGYGKRSAGVVLFVEAWTPASKVDELPNIVRNVLALVKSLQSGK